MRLADSFRQPHCYLVTYDDISSPKRWRKVFRLKRGYGEHVQLSVFVR